MLPFHLSSRLSVKLEPRMAPLSPQPHAVQTAPSAPYDGVITAFAGGQVSESGRPGDKTGAAGEERVMKQKKCGGGKKAEGDGGGASTYSLIDRCAA